MDKRWPHMVHLFVLAKSNVCEERLKYPFWCIDGLATTRVFYLFRLVTIIKNLTRLFLMSSTKWSHKCASPHPQDGPYLYMATMHKVYGSHPKHGTSCHIIHLGLDPLVRTPLRLNSWLSKESTNVETPTSSPCQLVGRQRIPSHPLCSPFGRHVPFSRHLYLEQA